MISCHLAIINSQRLTVIASTQSDSMEMGWVVRTGASFDISLRFASVRVIAAHLSEDRQNAILQRIDELESGFSASNARDMLRDLHERGYEVGHGKFPGIIDVSCPILDQHGQAIAAITIPLVENLTTESFRQTVVVPNIQRAAARITAKLGG